MFEKSLFVLTILTLSLGISTPAKVRWFSDWFGETSNRLEKKERLERDKRERKKEKERRQKDDSLKYDEKTSGFGKEVGGVIGGLARGHAGGKITSKLRDKAEKKGNQYAHNKWNKKDKNSTMWRSIHDD